MKRVVVIGGGFAGMWAALAAASEADRRRGDVAVTLVSRDAYLTNRPRLYEAMSDDLRYPLAPTLAPAGVAFIEGEVETIDTAARRITVRLADGNEALAYDRLVLAAGSVLRQLSVPGLAEHGFDIDSFAAAGRLDAHLRAVLATSDVGHDCVVIIGGGFTGIELATEMRDRIAGLAGDVTAAATRVVVVEQAAAIGPDLGPGLRPAIEAALSQAGVEPLLNRSVARVDGDAVMLDDGTAIPCRTVINTAGLRASPLAAAVSATLDELGRLPTDDHLRVDGIPALFAAGDVARARVDDDHVALMSCQHAMTMGRYAGCNAARDLLGLPLLVYRQPRYVTCLDLGRAGAVFTRGWERQVELQGEAAKQLKRSIVTERIAPPTGSRADILAAAALNPDGDG